MSHEAVSETRAKPTSGFFPGVGGWLMILFVVAILWAGRNGGSRIVESTIPTENRVMATTVANAVENFIADHDGALPSLKSPAKEGQDIDADTSSTAGLIAILLGKVPGAVPSRFSQGTDYLDGYKQAKADPKTPTGWKNGLIYEDGRYSVLDGYGNLFRVRLDANGDGLVANPNANQADQRKTRLKKRVILWGAGKDGDWNTWDDNPMTWE